MRALIFFLALTTAALAQDRWAPPDRELWLEFKRSTGDVAMPRNSHTQLWQLMDDLEKRSYQNFLRADAARRAQERRELPENAEPK